MNPLIARLRAIHRLETGEEMDEFDNLIERLAGDGPPDPALLPDLLLSFFDDTEGNEVMWRLLHFVERYPDAIYVSQLVDALPQMVPQAREWALLLLGRSLNSESCRPLLRDAFKAETPERQQTLLALLRELVRQDPPRASDVDEVTAS